jgi:hypothetical protein
LEPIRQSHLDRVLHLIQVDLLGLSHDQNQPSAPGVTGMA